MKPELEHISINKTNQSFQFFTRRNTSFLPYWHYHPELELTLITKGDGTRFVGDSISNFSDLDLVLIGKNLPHHWVSTSKEENQEAYIIQFTSSMFENFIEFQPFFDLFIKAKRGLFFGNASANIISLIIKMKNAKEIKKLKLLIEILDLLSQENNYTFLASENYINHLNLNNSKDKISKTTNYIIENINQNLTVAHMSEFTHMVPQSFCRWFKKHSGHSFVSFLNQIRIEKACQFLLYSDLSIEQIAFSCGYKTLSHFNRTFKRLKNSTPSNFRKLNNA